MKKLIVRIVQFSLFFIIFTLLINSIYLLVIAKTDWNLSKRIESLRFENPELDMLIFGSSIADYGVDAEYLTNQGIKAFNFAMVGSSVKT